MSIQASVLVVEDEKDISELIVTHLKREGHVATVVDNGEEALRSMAGRKFDLVLLDWMLPGLSGLEVCKRVRQRTDLMTSSQVPVLMVTARVDISDIVLGLEIGADDYLTKPFEIAVLLARVRALLRRTSQIGEIENTQFIISELRVNATTYEVTCGKTPVQLTPSEFKLLLALCKNQGRVLTREKLIDFVQGEGVSVVDRAIDTHVFGLRKKLGKCAQVVETIRGIGYRVKN